MKLYLVNEEYWLQKDDGNPSTTRKYIGGDLPVGELKKAVLDMENKNTTVALFGDIHGKFIYSYTGNF